MPDVLSWVSRVYGRKNLTPNSIYVMKCLLKAYILFIPIESNETLLILADLTFIFLLLSEYKAQSITWYLLKPLLNDCVTP